MIRKTVNLGILLCGMIASGAMADSVDVSECQIAGIAINDSPAKVELILGKPAETGPKCDGCFDVMNLWYFYDGLRVQFNGSDVYGIEASDPKYRLPSGIGVGSSREEIEEYYGESNPDSDGADEISYHVTFSGKRKRSWPFTLTFNMLGDVVSELSCALRNEA